MIYKYQKLITLYKNLIYTKKEKCKPKKQKTKKTSNNSGNHEIEIENLDSKEENINNLVEKKLESDEENNLDKEFKEFIDDNSDSLEFVNSEEENEKEEMKDMIADFLDIPLIKDNDLLKKKNNISDIGEKLTLNNPTNPFIKENMKIKIMRQLKMKK